MTDHEALARGVALLPELRHRLEIDKRMWDVKKDSLTFETRASWQDKINERQTLIAALEAAEALSQENRVLEDMLGKFKDYRRKLEAELVVVKKGLKNTTAERIAKGGGFPKAKKKPVDLHKLVANLETPSPTNNGEAVEALVLAAKKEAFDEALSIAEGSYDYGEQQNEIIAGIRAAIAAIKPDPGNAYAVQNHPDMQWPHANPDTTKNPIAAPASPASKGE